MVPEGIKAVLGLMLKLVFVAFKTDHPVPCLNVCKTPHNLIGLAFV